VVLEINAGVPETSLAYVGADYPVFDATVQFGSTDKYGLAVALREAYGVSTPGRGSGSGNHPARVSTRSGMMPASGSGPAWTVSPMQRRAV
jgi:hypothetical protein